MIYIFYHFLNLAYFSVLPMDKVKSDDKLIAVLFFKKLFGQGPAQTIMPILITVSIFANVMVINFVLIYSTFLLFFCPRPLYFSKSIFIPPLHTRNSNQQSISLIHISISLRKPRNCLSEIFSILQNLIFFICI